jgi:bifunctional UDP-N-acetylglucosamine pyrophosphorylase/glucosamine-1-phosphate N-acetyltransferase
MKTSVVLLAAGLGTRMRSSLPKVLHPIAGKPMIWHILEAVKTIANEKPVVVIGHGAEQVSQILVGRAVMVRQEPQLGTAHAVMQAESVVKGKSDLVLVCYADMPLLRAESFQHLIDVQTMNKGPISILTVTSDDPRGFGRILRKKDNSVEAIVEETGALKEQLSIKELNVGCYCFNSNWLWDALPRISKNPDKAEYYLTDIVGLAVADNLPVQAVTLEDGHEAIGINSRVHLAEVEAAMRSRINRVHMLNGVTLMDPASTYIDAGVLIGEDTTIMPNTFLQGEVSIGENCVVGPNTIIKDSIIEAECSILSSVLEGARVEGRVHIGPFARLRKGAHLMTGVHMGNFGEVKESVLGPGVKMGHFSYVGNAKIGAETNIGAGTITCNFDGEQKHETTIGENVFIGSDTMLVAPLKIGDRARTGAGAVVTKNVPPDTLVVGMPARAIKKSIGDPTMKTEKTK